MKIHGAIPPEYQNVTDTNVGKMTEQEAIEELRIARESNSLTEYPSNESLDMAIEALQFQASVVRCENCVYCVEDDVCYQWSLDGLTHSYVKDYDYCSKGKRRDEE